MLDWLLKHPIVIFVIIMVVSSLIKQMKSSGEAPPPANGPKPFGGGDGTADDERTRRLQEEIRRKIAERRGHSVPPPVPVQEEAEPLFPAPRWSETVEEPSPYKLPQPPPLVETVPAVDPVLERQRELAEQLAAFKALQAARKEEVYGEAAPATGAANIATARQSGDVHFLRELRNARSLRKAMILREVLGPPVALK